MDEMLKTAVSQVPNLCVLAIIIRWVLNHLKERDLFMQNLHSEHVDARKQSREVLHENAEAIKNVAVALQEVRDVIKSCPKNRG